MRNVRIAAGAAALVAALAVTGCSSDSDDGGKKDSGAGGGSTASSAPDDGGSSDGSSGSSGSSGSTKDAEGIWSATTGGQPVVLVIGAKQASLSTGDGHLCTGTVADGGKPTLLLKCADGSTDRTTGAIESNDGSTMKVSWDGGTNDAFTKSKDGKLPDGLPSGLPSN
ncbi:hypothetical protein GTW43_28915 [Streptomyces sp. SID5785]|uniref:hypothetical protein n=1 Tax=Streptomyces sp. SID5785 TaxID=2690309 RepID=UPI001361DC40|nr:hypothetical protein [Streptomyces sp. SID5785]MZD09069.1 hypothetical protein [Streptomyces sp. SID5785]